MTHRLSSAALLLALLTIGSGCVEHHQGAVVQMNLGRDALPFSALDEHYALYALFDGQPVPVVRFKVMHSIDTCGANGQLTSEVRLVQRFEGPSDTVATLCPGDRRLGTLDTVNLAAAQLVGGIRYDSAIDLSEVERVIITVQDDVTASVLGAERPSPPGEPVLVADVAAEVAPFDVECTDPVPAARRGVRRGIWVRAPGEVACAGKAGVIVIVPAIDETL